MSKQKIAPTRSEGIPTPASVAETAKSGNSPGFSAAGFAAALDRTIDDHVISPMQTAVDVFGWLETLSKIIQETAEDGLSTPPKKESAMPGALRRIATLGEIANYICADFGNAIDCEREMLRDEHLPRLIAELPRRGEA